jgi:hypothetical protein
MRNESLYPLFVTIGIAILVKFHGEHSCCAKICDEDASTKLIREYSKPQVV